MVKPCVDSSRMLYHIMPRLLQYASLLTSRVPAHGYWHLLLDLYHARLSQHMHMGLGPPSAGKSYRECRNARMLKVLCFSFVFWGGRLNLIPYVWKMVSANVPVQGWIMNHYESGFFYSSSEVLGLSAHYIEVANICVVTCNVINGHKLRKWPLDTPWTSPKCFLKIHQWILHHTTSWHTCICISAILFDSVSILGSHHEVLDGSAYLWWKPLYPCSLQTFLILTEPFRVRYYYACVSFMVLVCFLLLEDLFWMLFFILNLLSAQVGYMPLWKASFKCSSFCSSSS